MNTSFTKKLVSEFLIRTPHPLSTFLALSCCQQVASPTEQRLGEYGCALVGQSPLGTGLPTRQRLGPSPPLAPSRFTATGFRPRLPPLPAAPASPLDSQLPTKFYRHQKGASHIEFLKNCKHQIFCLPQNPSLGRCNCSNRPCPGYRICPNNSC